MSKNTLKKKLHFRRNTVKNKLLSGGVKNKVKFSVNSKEFVPSASPLPINNITKQLEGLTINEKALKNFTELMGVEMLKAKARIENAVAIDCEMVGVGSQSALAHVAIVGFTGEKLYDKYVIPKDGIKSITNYRTAYSGITKNKLEHLNSKTHSFQIVSKEVANILKGKTIVGHGLENDFKVLGFEPKPELVWDSTKIDMYLQSPLHKPDIRLPRKLKAIAKEFSNNNIQSNTKTGHSPLEDARASMNLYRIYYGYDKKTYKNMSK
jgi:ribosomal protein L15